MSVDHTIQKPKLFISHATSDGEFATTVQREIEKVFANGVDVFCTSSPGAIAPGRDWLSQIEETLGTAQAVIAIVTPTSVERPWLWFEVGAVWGKGRSDECRIYPLCAPEIDLSELPSPLDRLQALSMGRAIDLKLLFEALIDQFGFGKISSFRASNISKRIPKYRNVKVTPTDIAERAFYSGKYSGYSDEELMEVLDTEFLSPAEKTFTSYLSINTGREDIIHNGKLVHFKAVDQRLELPPGTARRLLVDVAARYQLEPDQITENTVRFKTRRVRSRY